MEHKEYPPNSHKYREDQAKGAEKEKKVVTKVVKGTARVKKKSDMRKLADIFIAEDVKNVKSYVLLDVLVPAIKNTILDIIIDSAKMFLGGGDRRRSSNASKVSYRNYYERKEDYRNDRRDSGSRSAYSHDDIVLDSRGEAEEVLARMSELIETYNNVSVADLYDLVGIPSQYTDNKYGWTNIRNAEPIRVRDGYLLKLPKPGPI